MPLVHTTGPHPDVSVSAVMFGLKIKMARERAEGVGRERAKRGEIKKEDQREIEM